MALGDRILLGGAMLNLTATTLGFMCGLISEIAYYVTLSATLTAVRVLLFWRHGARSELDEKVLFAFSHFLTVPALVIRHPTILLAATSLLMAGRALLMAFVAYRVATFRPVHLSFLLYAINNEGILWAVRRIFRIVVDQWPDATDAWREIASQEMYFFYA